MKSRTAIFQQRNLFAKPLMQQLFQEHQVAQNLEVLVQCLQGHLPGKLLFLDVEVFDQYGLNRSGDFCLCHDRKLLAL